MFWLSFADPNLPKGNQFLGACIVDGDTFEQSVKESIKLGINPGGEVVGLNIDDCYVDTKPINPFIVKEVDL